MLYICIPAYNEASTIGVLLWRIRKALQDFDREYEVLVYNDASDDSTNEVLEPYTEVLPLTVLGTPRRVGYAASVDALIRNAVERTKYGRRDAVVIMQGDFTDQPEHLPELVRRFEGGADVVIAESHVDRCPTNVRRLRRFGSWALRAFGGRPVPQDPFGSYRLFRVSVLRELIKARGDAPVVQGDRWAANADLLLGVLPFARRVEALPLDGRYDLRVRESRVRPWADALQLLRFARGARSRQLTPAKVRT
ncbi:MAG TPA: glycosyltransferase family 2 protein [Gemmatimonadaceae bacterium]|nr:glycosyltransferase family 2 protein [Gemmatimonadaceae bacterium]